MFSPIAWHNKPIESLNQEFCKAVARLCIYLLLPQEELGMLLGVGKRYVFNWVIWNTVTEN